MSGRLILTALCVLAIAGPVASESDFMKSFNSNYETLDLDLLNNDCEVGEISDFVYRKDVATITFEKGTLYLLRHVLGRPTTAVFIGAGRAQIEIPVHVERQSLLTVARDSVINESFETCFIRMGDDFDLLLREKFHFDTTEMGWRDFNTGAKKSQGEVFFKPTMWHTYDNYFQLIRSLYERRADGFFWIDFNRWVFSFDPNVPEEVTVAYEHQGGDVVATPGAVFQRREKAVYDDTLMSQIPYATTMLDRSAAIEMGGLDGKFVEKAATTIKVLVNADSLRFVNLFLHRNLHLDSILYDGSLIDHKRRKDFAFVGAILPTYRFAGDTLTFSMWYSGKQYDHAMPWVDNPQPTPHRYVFTTPKGYNYFMPGMGAVTEIGGGKQTFEATPSEPYDDFFFHCYASGLDTVATVTDIGVSMNFLIWDLMDKKYSECFVPHDVYQSVVTETFNFMVSRLGMPPGAFAVYASPGGKETMPGVTCVPQLACVREGVAEAFGGFRMTAGLPTARLWFGQLMQPATYREAWLCDALAEYVSLMAIQSADGSSFYSNLNNRRDSVHTIVEYNNDLPLAVGNRASAALRANKGLWVLHMLRMLMFDLDTKSDQIFLRFLQDLSRQLNTKPFTNRDFVKIAEQHYGQPLDWFFGQWLYDLNYPEFDVFWSVRSGDRGYYVDFDVKMLGVDPGFRTPVIMRVALEGGGSVYARRTIADEQGNYEVGPFEKKPEDFVFNEFFGVLGKSNLTKR